MIRIAIVDDEPIHLNLLAGYVRRILGDYSLQLDLFFDGKRLDSARDKMEYDIYLLDIELDGENGIEIAKNIRRTSVRAQILFITSHSNYALEGYDAFPLGYLLKPVNEEKLAILLQTAVEKISAPNQFIEITENYRKVCLSIDDIVAFIRTDRKTVIFLLNMDEYESSESLVSLHARIVNPEQFLAIHRHIVVKVEFVTQIEKAVGTSDYVVRMRNGLEFPVSKSGIRALKKNVLKVRATE